MPDWAPTVGAIPAAIAPAPAAPSPERRRKVRRANVTSTPEVRAGRKWRVGSHTRDECVTRSSRRPARRYHTGARTLRTQGWLTTVREQNSTPAGTWATRAGTPAGTQPPTMDGVRRGRPGRADRRRDRRQRRPRTGHHRRARVAGRAGDHGLPGRGEGRGRPRVASRRRAGAHRG